MVVTQDTEQTYLSLQELSDICHLSPDKIHLFIEYEIIRPQGHHEEEWMFDLLQLKRMKTALRLQHDLEVNLAGVALVLDLLEQLHETEEKLAVLEKHFLK